MLSHSRSLSSSEGRWRALAQALRSLPVEHYLAFHMGKQMLLVPLRACQNWASSPFRAKASFHRAELVGAEPQTTSPGLCFPSWTSFSLSFTSQLGQILLPFLPGVLMRLKGAANCLIGLMSNPAAYPQSIGNFRHLRLRSLQGGQARTQKVKSSRFPPGFSRIGLQGVPFDLHLTCLPVKGCKLVGLQNCGQVTRF